MTPTIIKHNKQTKKIFDDISKLIFRNPRINEIQIKKADFNLILATCFNDNYRQICKNGFEWEGYWIKSV